MNRAVSSGTGVTVVGRYALYEKKIAAGGMATVHLGRLLGPEGFSRTVAIKRLHPHLASDPQFVSMFLDEARLAARIRHPNVVATLDVVSASGELFLVMDYVAGEPLSRLLRAGEPPPIAVTASVMAGVLYGLDAAHDATDERGEPLGLVHRDVSPQNILVGTDGIAKLLDFGVAKAAGRAQVTKDGQVKGKLSYLAPEQLRGKGATRQADIYAAGVVLWETIAGRRLFFADNEGAVLTKILESEVHPPSYALAWSPKKTLSERAFRALERLDRVAMRALDRDPARRFATAREMAGELEHAVATATPSEVGIWLRSVASDVLAERAAVVADVERRSSYVDDDDTASLAATLPIGAVNLADLMGETMRDHRPPIRGAPAVATAHAISSAHASTGDLAKRAPLDPSVPHAARAPHVPPSFMRDDGLAESIRGRAGEGRLTRPTSPRASDGEAEGGFRAVPALRAPPPPPSGAELTAASLMGPRRWVLELVVGLTAAACIVVFAAALRYRSTSRADRADRAEQGHVHSSMQAPTSSGAAPAPPGGSTPAATEPPPVLSTPPAASSATSPASP